ncbi:MAG: AsmA family protein [Gammaproteobacteria bacterium]
MIKFLLTFAAAIVLLTLIAAITLPFFIDPNDFKPEIKSLVKENTGRTIDIEGDLQLSVFPWLGISTGKVSLGNAPGFPETPFAEVSESNVRVKLVPLLSKKIEISRIVLKGLSLNLTKNKDGSSNWEDLNNARKEKEKKRTAPEKSSPVPKKDEPSLPPSLASLAIAGISVNDAEIVWDDRSADRRIELKNLNLETDALEFDEPVDIDLSVKLLNAKPQLTEDIVFKTALTLDEELNDIRLADILLKTVTEGENVPGGVINSRISGNVRMNLSEQTASISELKASIDDLHLSADLAGKNIMDSPYFAGPVKIEEFNPRILLEKFGKDVSSIQDSGALSRFSLQLDLKAAENGAEFNNLDAYLDETRLNGSINIADFSKPTVAFDLAVDAINLDRYLQSSKEKSKKDGKKEKLVKKASPAAAAAAGGALIPVDFLKKLVANGGITIGRLKIYNLDMKDIKLHLSAANGVLETEQTVDQFYQGGYSGKLKYDVRNRRPLVSLNEKLSNVQIEPLLLDLKGKAAATGAANLKATLQGQGDSADAIKSTLDGDIDVQLRNGVIRGFNLHKIVGDYKAILTDPSLLKGKTGDQTDYKEISATASVNNGLIKNDDLLAKTTSLNVKGKGTADLVSEKLNYNLNAQKIKKAATGTEPEKTKDIPVAIRIGGTFSKPSYKLDLESVVIEKQKEKIEEKKQEIIDKIDKKLGPGASDLFKKFF